MCISGETSRSMCISSCTLCWPESGILFFTWFSYKDCPSGQNWMLLNVIYYIYSSCFLRLQVSLVTIIMIIMILLYIYILYTLSVPKNNQTIPKRRMFLEHKWVQHPWGESSKSTAGVGLTEIPTGGPQRLQARVLIHLTGGSGFLKYVFLRLHRVDRLVGDFHCPRDYIELMRLLSRKCKYRIHVDYEHMHLAPKSSYLRMQVWDHFVFECIFFNV